MTTEKRRGQNASNDVPEDIDAILDRQLAQQARRDEYNKRPEVKERRKVYQAKQARGRAMVSAALKGNKELLTAPETLDENGVGTGGFGFSSAAADELIAKAQAKKNG